MKTWHADVHATWTVLSEIIAVRWKGFVRDFAHMVGPAQPGREGMQRVVLVCAVAGSLLMGCATQISQEEIAAADYGPRPPANYKSLIKAEFAKILIDPTSPIYEFDTPRKGYTKKSSMFNTQQRFGWRVCGTVNSKNRYGGYVGRVPYFVLFRDGQVVESLVGKITDNKYGLNLVSSAILQACER